MHTIRKCPKCATGEMYDMHYYSNKLPKRLYICNKCSYYYLFGYNLRRIILFLIIIAIIAFLGDWSSWIERVLMFLLAFLFSKELIQYITSNHKYPIIKRIRGKFEPNEKQLDGVEKYNSDQTLGTVLTLLGGLIPIP